MFPFRHLFRARLALWFLMVVGLMSTIGCNGDWLDITGTVTVNGVPVPGTIYFMFGDDDDPTSATLDANGHYSCKVAEGATYTILLTNLQAPLPGLIPDRYASIKTSDLQWPYTRAGRVDIQITRFPDNTSVGRIISD